MSSDALPVDGSGPLRPPRPGWDQAPPALRSAIERWLGAPVVSAVSQPGGFSPGLAVRLQAANGRRAFVKAVAPGPNLVAPAMLRRERLIVSALPAEAPIPRLLLSYDEGEEGWVALVFSDVEGANPVTPWQSADLRRVLHAMTRLAETLTPSPLALDLATPVGTWSVLTGRYWESLAASGDARASDWPLRHAAALAEIERGAAEAAAGGSLIHLDVRSDNLILARDDVWFVDWAHARIGAPWLDLLFFAPSVEMEGGPRPEDLLEGHPLLRGVDRSAVDAVVAAIAGFFTWQGLQSPPPGLPTVRAFQAAQGAVARRWLARRLGLPPPG